MIGKNWPKPPLPLAPCAKGKKKEISVKKDKIRLRQKKSEVNRLIGDNRKAKKLLKWKPKYSNINGFKKGLEQTIDWFTNNLSDYKNDYLI